MKFEGSKKCFRVEIYLSNLNMICVDMYANYKRNLRIFSLFKEHRSLIDPHQPL